MKMLSINDTYKFRRTLSKLYSLDGTNTRGDLVGELLSFRDDNKNIASIDCKMEKGEVFIEFKKPVKKNTFSNTLSDVNSAVRSYINSNKDLIDIDDSDMGKFEEFIHTDGRVLFDASIVDNVIVINL